MFATDEATQGEGVGGYTRAYVVSDMYTFTALPIFRNQLVPYFARVL